MKLIAFITLLLSLPLTALAQEPGVTNKKIRCHMYEDVRLPGGALSSEPTVAEPIEVGEFLTLVGATKTCEVASSFDTNQVVVEMTLRTNGDTTGPDLSKVLGVVPSGMIGLQAHAKDVRCLCYENN